MIFEEIQSLWRARALCWVLTRREISARYAGTAAGMAWAYVQPLLSVAIYYLIFDIVFAMRLGENAPHSSVGTFLIVGFLPWMAFSDSLNRGMTSLLDAGSLLQKNSLPPVLFPVRSVLASMIVFGPLLLLLALAYTPLHHFSIALLTLIPLLIFQLFLTVVLAYLLAIFSAALRDTTQLVSFFLSLGVFISPILFPLSQFPESWRWVLWFNPMTALVLGYQSILLQGQFPPVIIWLVLLIWLLFVCFILNIVLIRSRDQLVDWL